jgi:hypothetical protein
VNDCSHDIGVTAFRDGLEEAAADEAATICNPEALEHRLAAGHDIGLIKDVPRMPGCAAKIVASIKPWPPPTSTTCLNREKS